MKFNFQEAYAKKQITAKELVKDWGFRIAPSGVGSVYLSSQAGNVYLTPTDELEMMNLRANCPHEHQRWINKMHVCVECGEVLK